MSTAKAILAERLAKGEINEQEYERLLGALSQDASPIQKSDNAQTVKGTWKDIGLFVGGLTLIVLSAIGVFSYISYMLG